MLGWAFPGVSTSTLRFKSFGEVSGHLKHSAKRGSIWRGVCSRQNPAILKYSFTRCSHVGLPKVKKGTSKVSILPLEVVQRIASGEVIYDYKSVVQELVENAIDAQSSKLVVDIDILNRSITVEDNGAGISVPNGLLEVAKCNATTKLCSLEQLENGIGTLGFRGQGLWSIASIAKRLSISSRTEDVLYGTSVSFTNDGIPIVETVSNVPMNTGTIVQAMELPWCLNVRENRRMVTECKEWLLRAALCHPQISFNFSRNGSLNWSSAIKAGEPQHQRMRYLAAKFRCSVSEFRSASISIPEIGDVSLVIGLPSAIHSASRSWVVTAVNGRCVDLDWIKRALCEAVQVPRGRYPVVFVHFTVAPLNVNWNISPQKTVMRFKNSDLEHSTKDACLALIKNALRSRILSDGEKGTTHSDSVLMSHDLNNSVGVGRFLQRLQKGEARRQMLKQDSQYVAPLRTKVIGQVLNTYILVEYGGGILLIEQHVADERAIYERLLRLWNESCFGAPKHETVLPSDTSEELLFSLTSLGVTFEAFCDSNETTLGFRVKTVPTLLATLPSPELATALLKLGTDAQTLKEAAASLSCQLAVRNGTTLNQTKMKKITGELLKCDNPHTCPHGRPIFVDLEVHELAKLFRRSWLPERSADDSLKTVASSGNSHLSPRIAKGVLE
ncbi:unnamed protein product [Agarophyton chilense]